ncbi:hypothetical protein BDC45DRAFT_517513 [Circinella umbellata]|nr:hypothetical protein BDC45DRAFT_517513 [Circinella umbellata]
MQVVVVVIIIVIVVPKIFLYQLQNYQFSKKNNTFNNLMRKVKISYYKRKRNYKRFNKNKKGKRNWTRFNKNKECKRE